MFSLVISGILQKHPLRRFPQEVEFLRRAFRDIKFFREIEDQIEERFFLLLFKKLQLEIHNPGDRVFNIGDIGKNYYIILKGSVLVLLTKTKLIDNSPKLFKESKTKEEKRQERLSKDISGMGMVKGLGKSSFFSFNSQENHHHHHEELDPKAQMQRALKNEQATLEEKKDAVAKALPQYWIPRSLGIGDAFGEIALQSDGDRRRTATIMCAEKTLFGVLSRDSYNEILDKVFKKKTNLNTEFFLSIDIFSHWNRPTISTLLPHVQEHKFEKGTVLQNQNELADKVYFIKEGEIELEAKVVMMDEDDPFESIQMQQMKKTLSPRKLKPQEKVLKVCILSETDYFGAQSCYTNAPCDSSALVYSSHAILMSLPKDKFINLVKEKYSIQKLKTHISEQLKLHQKFKKNFRKFHKEKQKKALFEELEAKQNSKNIDTEKSKKKPLYLQIGDIERSVSNFDNQISHVSGSISKTLNLDTTTSNQTAATSRVLMKDQLYSLNDAKTMVASFQDLNPTKSLTSTDVGSPTKKRIIPEFPMSVIKKKVDDDHEKIRQSVKRDIQLEELKHDDPAKYQDEMLRKEYENSDYEYMNFVKGGLPIITKPTPAQTTTNNLRLGLIRSPGSSSRGSPSSRKHASQRFDYTGTNYSGKQKASTFQDVVTETLAPHSSSLTKVDLEPIRMKRIIRSLKLDDVFEPKPLDALLTYRRSRRQSSDVEGVLVETIKSKMIAKKMQKQQQAIKGKPHPLQLKKIKSLKLSENISSTLPSTKPSVQACTSARQLSNKE